MNKLLTRVLRKGRASLKMTKISKKSKNERKPHLRKRDKHLVVLVSLFLDPLAYIPT